jgi:hypothetical protein
MSVRYDPPNLNKNQIHFYPFLKSDRYAEHLRLTWNIDRHMIKFIWLSFLCDIYAYTHIILETRVCIWNVISVLLVIFANDRVCYSVSCSFCQFDYLSSIDLFLKKLKRLGFKIQEKERIANISTLHIALLSDPWALRLTLVGFSVYHNELWMYKYTNI